MPSVEIKDEMRGGAEVTQGGVTSPAPTASSVQITANENLQSTLVEVILEDYQLSKSEREERKYGTTSKGESLKFTDWFKRIKDLYNGERIPKTIPWQFCSNRSLRIATAILDLIHARLFPAVWNEDLVRWRPGTHVDVPKADRINKFMDWWVRVGSPLRSFFDVWVKLTAGFGDSLTESSWEIDEIGQGKIARRVIPKDCVFTMTGARDVQKDPVLINQKLLYRQLEESENHGAAINVSGKLAEML